MGSLRLLLNHQNRFVTIAVASLLVIMVPILASAAQITERSIELSSSSKAMESVTYDVNFTAVNSATGFVIEFCSNSPLIGIACTAPTGLDASGATSSDATLGTLSANKIVGTDTIAAGTNNITLENIDNPTDAGTIYARILTYNGGGQTSHTSEAPGSYVDNGSVALSITDTVGVSGAVLETLTFCAASVSITDDCANAAANPPVLALGEGTPKALTTGAVSSGDIYAQISTNAVDGAVVRLKSSATGCGGLVLTGGEGCIAAQNDEQLVADFAANNALFGLKVAGAGGLLASGDYNNTRYFLNYAGDNNSGVTSVYGDPVFNTNSGPITNANATLTFGAGITNQTPAGMYSADLSLIATGTF